VILQRSLDRSDSDEGKKVKESFDQSRLPNRQVTMSAPALPFDLRLSVRNTRLLSTNFEARLQRLVCSPIPELYNNYRSCLDAFTAFKREKDKEDAEEGNRIESFVDDGMKTLTKISLSS